MTQLLVSVLLAVGVASAVAAQTPSVTIFRARADAVHAIEQAQSVARDPEVKAELALHWAEAIQRTASAIPFGRASGTEPFASWIREHARHIVYNEPGGRWMLRPEAVLNLHKLNPEMAATDDLAWLMATNGVPGECEGYISCYVDRLNLTYGRYLELHPKGRHADHARTTIENGVKGLLEERNIRQMFVRSEQCPDFDAPISQLSRTMSTTRPYQFEEVLALLDQLRAWCK